MRSMAVHLLVLKVLRLLDGEVYWVKLVLFIKCQIEIAVKPQRVPKYENF